MFLVDLITHLRFVHFMATGWYIPGHPWVALTTAPVFTTR